MPGLDTGIHLLHKSLAKVMDARVKPGNDRRGWLIGFESAYAFAAPIMSGCRASETAGEARITSACAPKIATPR
jgi:hypothetical protein